jgi:hypothetical protein
MVPHVTILATGVWGSIADMGVWGSISDVLKHVIADVWGSISG